MISAFVRARAVAVAALVACTACNRPPADSTAAESPSQVSVTVAAIQRTTLHAYVQGWGRVEPEPTAVGQPAASARVTAPVPGVLTAVLTSEGQRVVRGTMLFRLDGRVADVAVERARQSVGVAEQLVRRQEQLGPGQATSQKAYQEAAAQLVLAQGELRAAELQRGLLDVLAPISGTVVRLNSRLGDAVDPSTALAEIVDLDRLVVSVSIRSVDVPQLRRGQRVEIMAATTPDAAQSPPILPMAVTSVGFIGSQVDAATDTVTVRARTPARVALRPGQFVTVRVVTEEHRDRLAVPVDSVVRAAGGNEVAVVDGDAATKMRVTLGLRENGLVEVQGDGLREGLSVVVQGAYGLPATSKITVIGR